MKIIKQLIAGPATAAVGAAASAQLSTAAGNDTARLTRAHAD